MMTGTAAGKFNMKSSGNNSHEVTCQCDIICTVRCVAYWNLGILLPNIQLQITKEGRTTYNPVLA